MADRRRRGKSHDRQRAFGTSEGERVKQLLGRNRPLLHFILLALALELPYRRHLYGERRSLQLECARFLAVVWISCRLLLAISLSGCEWAAWRATLYDWTIYYPIARRTSIVRIFLGLCMFQLCYKVPALRFRGAPFEPELIDYICKPPPPPPPSPSPPTESAHQATPQKHISCFELPPESELLDKHLLAHNKLRNRRHWFQLALLVQRRFWRNLWIALAVLGTIIVYTNIQLGWKRSKERDCDIEWPLLRLVGLLEVNFLMFETSATLLTAFTFCNLVCEDLLLQMDQVNQYLRLMIKRQLKRAESAQDSSAGLAEPTSPLVGYAGPVPCGKPRLHASNSCRLNTCPLYQPASSRMSLKLQLDSSTPPPPSVGLRQRRVHSLRAIEIDAQLAKGAASQANGVELNAENARRQGAEMERYFQASSELLEAQNKVVQLFSSMESQKRPIGFVGNGLFLWMLVSLSFASLLLDTSRGHLSKIEKFIYVLCCAMTATCFLIYTGVCASVYQRAVRLAGLVFRLCSLNHSRALALRWNKIFMAWLSPNRLAFKLLDVIHLTHLSILKSLSILLSGLTLILEHLS